MSPGGFDFGCTLGRRLVEAGQQLGSHVGAFFCVEGEQGEGNRLRTGIP